MTLQLLGAAMLAAPFALLIAWMSDRERVWEFVAVACATLVVEAWVVAGVWLLTGGR